MNKAHPIFTQFNAGELSPLLDGRVDLDQYYNGLETCLNFAPTVQGPLTRRPGLASVAQAKDTTTASRAIRFQFSSQQAYVVEFGDAHARFHLNHASLLEDTVDIASATSANPVVVTTTGSHGYADGDEIFISAVAGTMSAILNGRRFLVANKTATTFELTDLDGDNIDGSALAATSSTGTTARVLEVTTPYAAADLAEIKYAQSADVMYLAHPDYAPRKLERTSATSFTLTEIDFQDGPFLSTNATTTTLTPSAVTGSVTLTASAVTGINDDTGFQTTDVGRYIRIQDAAGNHTWAEITARASTVSVTALIRGPDLSSTAARTTWRLGAWSETTGYPAAVFIFESRLWWAGGVDFPQLVVASRSGDFENLSPTDVDGTVVGSSGITVTLDAAEVNAAYWLSDDEKGLLVGTAGGIWILRASSQNEAITPANINAKRPVVTNASNIQAVRASDATLFAEGGRKIREMAFVFETDGFRAPDMTLVSEHITRGGITELAFVRRPQATVWAVRADGVLLGMTYEREQQVVAWHRHVPGGWSDAAKTTPAKIESITAIPTPDGEDEELWCIVQRYVDGKTRRFVEYMHQPFEQGDAQDQAKFLDAMATYTGAAATEISGLWHLVGETVSILADGAVVPDQTVTADGTITLDVAAAVAHIGYNYSSDMVTHRIEAGAVDGTAQGKRQRVNRVVFRFHQTLGAQVGPSLDQLDTITFRDAGDLMDTPPPLFDGDVERIWEDSTMTGSRIAVRQSQPLPMTITAIMPQVGTSNR